MDDHRQMLVEREDGWFYTGPLGPAIGDVALDRHVLVTEEGVEFYDDPEHDQLAEFGNSENADEAWRYALGAYYGPLEPETPVQLLNGPTNTEEGGDRDG